MAKRTLTNADFCRAAARLKCEVAAIKAVSFVESRGNGFYSDGFPVILFERHIFRKYTQGRYNRSHPHLSGPAGNYGAAGQNQRKKFNEAFALNPEAAMKSCSWGKFQIMGFNHDVCGFSSVGAFVDAMKESEGRHLDAFVQFVISNNLARFLRALAWASFAKGYNGAGYAKNYYDTKMASAYARFSKENIDCNSAVVSNGDPATNQTQDSATPIPVDTPSEQQPANLVEQTVVETEGDTVTATTTTTTDTVTVTAPEPYMGVGFWAVVKRDLAAATGGNLSLSGLSEYAQQASGWPEWVVSILTKLAVGALIATAGYFIFRVIHYVIDTWKKNEKVKTEVAANTSKDRFNIEWS